MVRIMDKIILEGIDLEFNIGVTPEERENKQKIIVDIELQTNLEKARETDNINDTINYSNVYKEIEKLTNNEFKLLEALANSIANTIVENFNTNVTVRVKKPAIKYAKCAIVEIQKKK
jgi:7,8-dihydroneopterin aldolase/epimerase/oxygenase